MQGALLCRIDRTLTLLLIASGSAVFANTSNTAWFGAVVMILSVIQFIYRFGVSGNKSLNQSREYQNLYTNESEHTDKELIDKLIIMEKSDSPVWSVLDSSARARTRIMRDIKDDAIINISPVQKITSWLSGDLPA
jgi:hypothetical protein